MTLPRLRNLIWKLGMLEHKASYHISVPSISLKNKWHAVLININIISDITLNRIQWRHKFHIADPNNWNKHAVMMMMMVLHYLPCYPSLMFYPFLVSICWKMFFSLLTRRWKITLLLLSERALCVILNHLKGSKFTWYVQIFDSSDYAVFVYEFVV